MIKYALRCAAPHDFESWFRDSAAFDALAAAHLVACPACGSTKVEKALMAPSVQTSRRRTTAPVPAPETAATAVAVSPPLLDAPAQKLRSMVRDLRSQLKERSTDVGTAFAGEARKIHEGLVDERAIHGVASPDEVRSLLDDGIAVLPLPAFPDDSN